MKTAKEFWTVTKSFEPYKKATYKIVYDDIKIVGYTPDKKIEMKMAV